MIFCCLQWVVTKWWEGLEEQQMSLGDNTLLEKSFAIDAKQISLEKGTKKRMHTYCYIQKS